MTNAQAEHASEQRKMLGQQLQQKTREAMARAHILSVSQLARESGVQRDTLYAWFRGDRTPKPDTLGKVAEVLDVPVGSLWPYTEQTPGDFSAALGVLAAELRAWRIEDRQRIDDLEVLVRQLGATIPGGPLPPRPGARVVPRGKAE